MKKKLLSGLCASTLVQSMLFSIQQIPYSIAPSRLSISGYTKLDAFLDSRQNSPIGSGRTAPITSLRDGEYFFWPQPFLPDCRGCDINAHPTANMLAIETRINMTALGPELCGAATKSFIEGEFFGQTDATINSFRMRHAFLTMDWPDLQLLFGEYWNPVFIPKCFAHVVSYNTGTPFDPYSRDPQIRVTKKLNHGIELSFTASSQVGRADFGPFGQNTIYFRNAIVPNLNANFQQEFNDILYGFQLDYKRLVPRLVNDFDCIVNESVNSVSALAYVHWTGDCYEQSFKFIFSQNLPDMNILGAYAVHTKSATDKRTYVSLNVVSLWYDIYASPDRLWQPGLFVAFEKNLGTSKTLYIDPATGEPIIYGNAPKLDFATRVSPRIRWNLDPIQFALELEITTASWGNKIDKHGRAVDKKVVTNFRTLFAAYYFF